jgi:hypothetical protein
MKSTFRPPAGHEIPHPESRIASVHRLNHPSGAVPQWRRRFQTVFNFFPGTLPPEIPRGIQYFTHLIRAGAGFLQQIHFGLLHFHLFGSHTDDRVQSAYKHATGWCRGNGDILKF